MGALSVAIDLRTASCVDVYYLRAFSHDRVARLLGMTCPDAKGCREPTASASQSLPTSRVTLWSRDTDPPRRVRVPHKIRSSSCSVSSTAADPPQSHERGQEQ